MSPQNIHEKSLPYKNKDSLTIEAGVKRLVLILTAEDTKQVGADIATKVGIKTDFEVILTWFLMMVLRWSLKSVLRWTPRLVIMLVLRSTLDMYQTLYVVLILDLNLTL